MIHVIILAALLTPFTSGETDPRDVTAINSLYVALGNPPLAGWIPNGGDPCLEAWQGVQCVNSNITGIVLRGLNLGGELSVNLDVFSSMIVLDLADNHIGGTLPINLPSTVRNLSLSANQLTGSIPVSLSLLSQLTEITFGNNHLDGEIPDAFQALSSLVNLDMSMNNFSGILPPSLKSLVSLNTLDLQDNHLSGTLDVLQDLPLLELNIENNIFSGPIPEKLLGIPNFKKDGNPFNTSIISFAPPPGPIVSEPPLPGPPGSERTREKDSSGPTKSKSTSPAKTENFWSGQGFKWLAVAVAVVLAIIAFGFLVCMFGCCKGKKQPDGLSKIPKVGLETRMKNFNDIESFKTMEKDEGRKVDHIIAIPQSDATPNENHKEKSDTEVMAAPSKPYQGNGKDMTGIDLSLMPPHLAPLETLNISPIGPTTITTRKIPRKNPNSELSVRVFTVASLQQYTNSFSEENLIGVGSLGSVYRAELPDGKLLAVKKLDTVTSVLQNEEEFLDLVASISKLQNGNIVELEGYCIEHGQRLLIYKYCSNGTLYEALHSDEQIEKLSWNARIRIALGSARALEYLHEICHPSIVHRNFKSANVLLDDELAVRVSDCGLASLISVATLSGQPLSQGYGDPEFETGTYSCQHEVYSFGVVMLELLTGRKSYDISRPRGEQYLVRWAIPQLHDIDALSRMVDPSLNRAYPAKSLSRFADIISLCVQSEPEFRPPMSEIVQDLLHMIQREPPNRR